MPILYDHELPFSIEAFVKKNGPRRQRMMARYRKSLLETLQLARTLAAPVVCFETFMAVDLPQITQYLPGAEQITLGVCTIGAAIEEKAHDVFQDDPLVGLTLDQIGSEWIGALAGQLYAQIRAAAQENGRKCSPAYRPGIGAWPLTLQQEIFGRLPVAEIGMELTDSLIMLPQKSASMVIAAGIHLQRSQFAPQGSRTKKEGENR